MTKKNSTLGMATFLVIFFGSNLIKHLGWRAGALATPVSMAVLAAPLFGVVIASKVNYSVAIFRLETVAVILSPFSIL